MTELKKVIARKLELWIGLSRPKTKLIFGIVATFSSLAIIVSTLALTPLPISVQSIALTAPVMTGAATADLQGVVFVPDVIVTASKAVRFAGVAPGFKNVMVILPGRPWEATNRDGDGAFSLTLDLTDFDTGPLPVRVFGWFDTAFGERQVTFDATLLLDNPAKPANMPPAPPQVTGMRLQYVDDFTGPTVDERWGFGVRQDGSQWGSSCHFTERHEPEFSESYSIPLPSFLRLRAKHRPNYQASNGWDQKWTSGLLSTARPDNKNLASFRKGAFEYRALLPLIRGAWPSSWALDLGNDETGANVRGSVELDGAEFYNQSLNSEYYANVSNINHAGTDGRNGPARTNGPDTTSEGLVYPPTIPDMAFKMRTILHVVGDTTMITYIDGVKIAERQLPRASTVGPFYWMLNMALGGGWPVVAPPAGTADLWVDYVRVWSAD